MDITEGNFSVNSQTTNFKSIETVFTWKINGTFKNERTQSEWYVNISSGTKEENSLYTSVFLYSKKNHLKDSITVKFFVVFGNSKNIELKRSVLITHTFTANSSWGWPQFKDRQDLLNSLPDDNLQVMVTIYEAIKDRENDIILRESSGTQTEPTLLTERRLLLEKMEYSDVVIKVEDVEIPAHRAILAAASPVFAAMLDHEMLENSNKTVQIQDFNAETIHDLLQYIYSRVAPDLNEMPIQRCLDLMRVADKYQLDELSYFFVKNIPAIFNANNVAQILAISDLLSMDELKEICLQHMCINKGECFKQMCFDSLAERQGLFELIVSGLTKQ